MKLRGNGENGANRPRGPRGSLESSADQVDETLEIPRGMTMRGKIRRASMYGLLAGAMALGLTPGGTAVAQTGPPVSVAALGNATCEAGEFCVFRDANRSGPAYDFLRGVDSTNYTPLRYPIVGGIVNDSATSVWNRTGCSVRIFRNGQFNAAGITVPPGRWFNMANTPVGNDAASSHDACV